MCAFLSNALTVLAKNSEAEKDKDETSSCDVYVSCANVR